MIKRRAKFLRRVDRSTKNGGGILDRSAAEIARELEPELRRLAEKTGGGELLLGFGNVRIHFLFLLCCGLFGWYRQP